MKPGVVALPVATHNTLDPPSRPPQTHGVPWEAAVPLCWAARMRGHRSSARTFMLKPEGHEAHSLPQVGLAAPQQVRATFTQTDPSTRSPRAEPSTSPQARDPGPDLSNGSQP